MTSAGPGQRPRRQRGATLVEYALGISLVVVASLGAITTLTNNARSNISSHGATAGAPDLPDTGISSTTSSTTPATIPGGTTTTTAAAVVVTTSYSNATFTTSGQAWFPSITVQATNSGTGNAMSNVQITVSWTWTERDGTVNTLSQQSATLSSGVTTFTLNPNPDLSRNAGQNKCVASVAVTVTTVTASGQTVTYTPTAPQTINGPNPC